jgi:hypothetical protein
MASIVTRHKLDSRLSISRIVRPGIIVLAVGAVMVATAWAGLRRRDVGWSRNDAAIRLVIHPFRLATASNARVDESLAQAVAGRLGSENLVFARVSRSDRGSDFVLDGEERNDGARSVLALQLRRSSQREVFWSATFWRAAVADSTLPSDLAAALTEALGRRPMPRP